MHTLFILTLTLFSALAAPGHHSGAPAQANEKAEVLKAERTYVDRLREGDIAALSQLFSDDYVVSKNHGEVWDKATHLGFIKSEGHKFIRLDFEDANVRIYGNTAVVTGKLTYQARDDGGEFIGQSRYTHVYVKQNGRWRMTTNHFNRFGTQVPVSSEGTPPTGPLQQIAGVTNKYCPVMAKTGARVAVDPKIRKEYKGQYVYFASQDCLKAFDADPEAAIAKLSPEDRAAITPNKLCPYTGLKTSTNFRSESEGKLIYFCCGHCKWEFEKIRAATQKTR